MNMYTPFMVIAVVQRKRRKDVYKRQHGDTAKTFYIGSKNSSIYFCLYEKEKEQKSKGIKTDIKLSLIHI